MKRGQNAFTLVELLAVIVILAIVLLITVPGVLSIISRVKEDAYQSQLRILKDAARNYVAAESSIAWHENALGKQTVLSLGQLQKKGYLEGKLIDPRNQTEIQNLAVLVTKGSSIKDTYKIVYLDETKASYPNFSVGMIPIVYNGSTWVKADETNEKNRWFDYSNQQWANIATVTEDVRETFVKASPGTEIPLDKINGMYVWIPRFKYKLFNVDGTISPDANPNLAGDKMIDVAFSDVSEPKEKGQENGQWYTMDGFTLGNDELSGLWVAKFATGYNQGDDLSTYTKEGAEVLGEDSTKILVKPNINSWRLNWISTHFHTVYGMRNHESLYGLSDTNDLHMAKNTEWLTMAYLTNSRYGKTGNPNALTREVRINNQDAYLTGCGATEPDMEPESVCHAYNTKEGLEASTTGNITGVYDTSGNSWTYLMTAMLNEAGTEVEAAGSHFSKDELQQLVEEGRYIETYAYGTSGQDYSRAHIGDGTRELGPFNITELTCAWYDDYADFVFYTTNPLHVYTWMTRGGMNQRGIHSGPLAYTAGDGGADRTATVRIILI